MKKFTGTKIFAWIFIIIPIFIVGYYIWIYFQTLNNFQISEKFIVEIKGYTGNYLIDIMQYEPYFFEKDKIMVNTNSAYSGALIGKNSSMNSSDNKYQARDGGLYDSSGKMIYISGWSNKTNDFHWTRDGKYYVRFINPDPKASLSEKIYIYDLNIGKYKYFDLIDQTGKRITVNKVVGILP